MPERELNKHSIICFVTCVKVELLNTHTQLLWMSHVPKHSRDHDDSEYVCEFMVTNKQTNKHTNKHW